MSEPEVALLPCTIHGLSEHRLVVRNGFNPYRECVECAPCEHINQKFHGDSTSCLDCGAYVEDDDSYTEREEESL